jgi:hypothetical protein
LYSFLSDLYDPFDRRVTASTERRR